MADGEVKIDTKLDTNGLNKGLKDMQNKLNDAGKQTETASKKSKGFADNLKNLNAGAIATAAGMAGATVAIKKTVDALNDCAAAYRVQKNAEEALQTAAKNNPYLNNESVYNLRQFASALQSMSEIGDEVSLQVMSQLAATGRNEEQIMQIMSAAADLAAATGQDIGSAAQQLNATLNGNAGALGRQIGAINNLTKEELENGRAIELVAQQYKGMAAATADVEVQLSNSWGDFKENIGRGWQNVTQPVKQFFLDVLNDINEATAKTNDLKEKEKNKSNILKAGADNVTTNDQLTVYQEQLDILKKQEEEIKKTYENQVKTGYMLAETAAKELANDPEYKKLQNDIKRWQVQLDRATKSYKNAQAEAEEKRSNEENEKKQAELNKKNSDATEYIQANKKALEEQIKAIQLKSEATGEEIDEQALYNAYLNSYIELITKSNGLVSENNTAAKERLELLKQEAEKLKTITDEKERQQQAEKLKTEADNILGSYKNDSIYDTYKDQQTELLNLKQELNDAEIEGEIDKKEKIAEIDEAMTQNRRQLWSGMANEVNGYAQSVNEIIQNAAKLALETENNRMKAELSNLELQYKKGEISEEEYQKKVSEAKKKGAKTQYQIEMAQWGANILSATANIAVGVTQALAQGGVAGIITGALVGAAGAVQLASIMAAKPIPHFASGGFIGGMNGASMGADNTLIAARGGELMVNAAQQRRLWDVLNGNAGTAGGGINLIVNNSASNMVSTSTQIDRNKIELMIDARVSEGLKKGRFNDGLNAANASMNGDYYGI